MSALETPVAPDSVAEQIDGFFGARAAEIDGGRASVREGVRFLGELGLPDANVEGSVELVERVGRSDLASAFSAWAHRMAIEYVSLAPPESSLRGLLTELGSATVLGATALAAGTARHLAGAPLPLTFREDGAEVRLDGRIPWASNLLAPFVAVTAAAHAGDESRVIVVALTDRTPGVSVAPYPELLALGATGSSSIALAEARVPVDFVISRELGPFIERILPRFLLLQSAFCLGLAGAALDEAAENEGPMSAVLRADVQRLRREVSRADRRLRSRARRVDRHGPGSVLLHDLLSLRLASAQLAGEAVHTELAGAGGRGYLRASATARRVREAAFLPVQSPTEVQLRWLLSRSA